MKKRFLVGLILGGMFVLVGCGENITRGENERIVKDNITQEEVERLPEDQKETELDKILAANRKFKKENIGEKDGTLTAISMSDENIPGKVQIPEFEAGEIQKAFNEMNRYLKEEKNRKVNKRGEVEEANMGISIDPRINKVYEDKDKGRVKGYENNNIFVGEYEDLDGSYKYLFLGRESREKPWKVIHDGTSYK